MGAAASLEHSQSAGLVRYPDEPQSAADQLSLPSDNDKRILMAQASANWHRMIVHANKTKAQRESTQSLSGPTRDREALERVHSTIQMFESVADGVPRTRSHSELVSPTHMRRSNSRSMSRRDEFKQGDSDIDTPFRPQSGSVSSSPLIKSAKSSNSIQAMGAQFRREELEQMRLQEIANSTAKAKSESDKHPIRDIPVISARELQELPPVRIDLKTRTSSSITIVWDVDFEALAALQTLMDSDGSALRPVYEVMYRPAHKSVDSGAMLGGVLERCNLWRPACDDTSNTKAVVTDLEPNTQYAFRCRRMGWTDDWGPEAVIRTGPGAPSPPTNLHAREVTSSSVLVNWSPPEKDNGLPVLSYILRMKPLGGEFRTLYSGRERVFLAKELLPNTVYVFEIIACNRVGEGVPSSRLASRTLPPGSPTTTPWAEMVDEGTNKLYYLHPKTGATAWTLPDGAVLDPSVSFKNKCTYLMSNITRMAQEARRRLPPDSYSVKLTIQRHNMLGDSLRYLRLPSADELLAGPLRVTFEGEEGIDGGGMAREWASEVAKLLVSEASGLMIQSGDNGEAIIDIRSSALHGEDCRWLFTALGKFIAKVLIDEHPIGVKFNELFLTWLTGKPPTLEDLKSIDPSMYRGLEWVLENPVEDSDLTFSASFEIFDSQQTVDFIPNGRAVAVTEENKARYVDLMMAWLISGRYEPALTHFLAGFHSVVPQSLLKHFTPPEMQLLLGGSPEISVTALRTSACYTGGFTADHCVAQWFWSIVEEMDLETLPQLLAFITGCACVPSSGGLRPPLTVTILENEADPSSPIVNMLPRAHTCFNQIVIPLYPSREVLKDKLTYALQNSTGSGFHIK
mmetsp:Transcript_10754/g.16337  ORF Transcript_10754/g.16337 Transcript_10754/m.16337 type:complete len:854 (-) Transcript_10754:260-2821(-)|eukprot:CAMPEP_0185036384 /NCGR_PEP_ID=MMETSP1103-20130426/29309_1 /TAXON_ID=36769 /ORGANISM="Paraphysomonas bandaiensis, Strain Caron Lab Isolate" /LENGTH=853 /DNA_ID=CAMNT_0027573903 /DNA_START=69 /DNA_END=2630 /DNA_ORIENTATION=+